MQIKPIRNAEGHNQALREIERCTAMRIFTA